MVNIYVLRNTQTEIEAVTFGIDTDTYPEALTTPMDITITLGNGHVIQTDLKFQYMEDPNITDIFPLESFIK